MLSFIAILVFGTVFLCSGLVVNFLQLLSALFVLPFSRRAYRLVNMVLMGSFWSLLVWLVDGWGRLKVRVFVDKADWDMIGKEHALVIANHRSDVDWVVGWVLAQRTGCLGGTRALIKQSVQYLPVIGWSMWFSEYLFLARNWAKDEATLKRGYERLRGFPRSLWVALFVEGTRFTPAKLAAGQEYARGAGITVPKNTLVPRTKGFVATVQGIRGFVPVVYDMTVMVPQGVPPPTFLGLLQRKETTLHVEIRRVPLSALPSDDDGLAKWCREAFLRKDALLDQHLASNTFGEERFVPLQPSLVPLLVFLAWTALWAAVFAAVAVRAVEAHALSWTALAWGGGVVGLIGLLMNFFLVFTQSEHSTPAPPPSSHRGATPGVSSASTHPHKE